MKKYTLLLLLTCGFFGAMAQSASTSVRYDKSTRPALMLLLPYNEEVSEGTIVQKLKEIGYNPESKGALFWKQNKLNGFYIFKGVELSGMNGQPVDLYFKVEPKNRKEKDKSYIYLMTSKGDEKFVSSETDAATHQAAQNFLNRFTEHSATYKHSLDVKNAEESVKSAEKKYAKLLDDEKDMTRKLEKLQQELQENKKQQEQQVINIENEKKRLQELKAKDN